MADIEVRPHGPYRVSGLPLARARMELGQQGHDQDWVTYPAIDTADQADPDGTYFLCRCGQSAIKPFCDGTHKRSGFDGTETADATAYREKARVMEGDGVVVRDARPLCEHAGFCMLPDTHVWKMVQSTDPEVLDTMKGMIDHCPSGALTRAADTQADDDEPDLPTQVLVVDDGPYLVTGGAQVAGAGPDGTAYEARNRMTLCRCGASKNKPFCDGSHAASGFRDG